MSDMTPADLTTGVLIGAAMIIIGAVPGLFEGLVMGVRNFEGSIRPTPPESGSIPCAPRWIAPAGAALGVFTVCAYLIG